MKRRRRKGFTLPEVMAGAVASIIVLLSAGAVLQSGHRSWNRGLRTVNLQREASYGMLRLSRPIKAGVSATVEGDGTVLKIYRENDWITFSCPDGSNALQCQIEGQDPETVINGIVEDVAFSVEGNRVTVDLKLKEGNLQTHFASTIMMRNYEE